MATNNEYLKQRLSDQNEDIARLENIADSLVCILFISHINRYIISNLAWLTKPDGLHCMILTLDAIARQQ